MTKKHIIPVGLDNGYGHIKAVNAIDQSSIHEPSAVVADDNKLLHDALTNFTDREHKKGYLVGKKALALGQVHKGSIDSSYIESNEYRVQALYALSRLNVDNVYLVTGLPVEFYKSHRKRLMNSIEKWSAGGIKIAKAMVIPQPLGTLMDVAYSASGQREMDLTDQKVGVIDIGHGTIDGIECYENEIVREKYKGKSEGVSRLHQDFLAYMQTAYPKQKHKLHEIDRYLRDNRFIYEGEQVDLYVGKDGKELKKFKKSMAQKVMSLVNEIWPDGTANLYRIIFTGGGAELLRDELMEQFPEKQVIIPETPSISNARGFAKLGLILSVSEQNAAQSKG